ncbi:MAG TPA: response regulator transcription factor [Thermoanaerobaculia bacterium]|nr:response regulator transcription factor [Thermoanaerobaculia bacterium]
MSEQPNAAVLAHCELFADAMRAALENAGVPVFEAGMLSEDLIADLRNGAEVIVLDAGTARDAVPWIQRLREAGEAGGIVAVIEQADDDHIVAVLEAGANAWIDRDATLQQLVAVIRSRQMATSARVVAMVGGRIQALARELRRAPATTEMLTQREAQVLRLLAEDLPNKEIGRRLGVWTHTVKTHLHNIYAKLGARSRREAVTRAMRLGLLQEPASDAREHRVDAIESAIDAIRSSRAKRMMIVSRALDDVMRSLLANEPQKSAELLSSIDASVAAVDEFTRIAQAAAAAGDTAIVLALFKSLALLLERYGPPLGSRFEPGDFDYFRFVGHELMVTLVAALLHERRWRLAGELLDQRWSIYSEYLDSLAEQTEKRGVLSMHAELLEARHTRVPLARMPFDEFVAADYFLFLRGELPPDEAPQQGFVWRPWSTAKMQSVPWFLREPFTDDVAKVLRVGDKNTLRARLLERAGRLELLWNTGSWQSPVTAESLPWHPPSSRA